MHGAPEQQSVSVFTDSWTWIPLTHVKDVEALKLALTVPNGAYFASMNAGLPTNVDSEFFCYTIEDGYIGVPRNFAYEKFLIHEVPVTVGPARQMSPWDSWPHRIELRDGQAPAVDSLLEPGDKILSLACGKGKSVVSLYALCQQPEIRLPALIVVHTKVLMEQWVKMIRTHLRMGLARVGRIQGKTVDYRGRPFTVAMLQSLVKKEYPADMMHYFNTIVFDEIHRLGAPGFSQAAPMFTAQRWGLSATHSRKDGNDKVFKLHCGRVAYTDLTQELKPKVYFIQTEIVVNMRAHQMWRDRTKINFAKLLNTLSYDEERNRLIMYYVNKAMAKDRTVLVLGERVEQLTALAEECGEKASPLVGPMKAAERTKALKNQTVFATAALAKEGLDRPAFDTLVIIIPTTNPAWLQQALGRILRKYGDKQQPKVLIFEDVNVPPMQKRCDKVRVWLRTQKIKSKTVKGGIDGRD